MLLGCSEKDLGKLVGDSYIGMLRECHSFKVNMGKGRVTIEEKVGESLYSINYKL